MAFEGKGVFVHNLPYDPHSLARLLNYLRFDWVAFKIADGGSPWGEIRNVQPEYVETLRQDFKGPIYGWSYNYFDGRTDEQLAAMEKAWNEDNADGIDPRWPRSAWDRGNGIPEIEAATVTERLHTLRLDGYICDAEIEAEKDPNGFKRFATAFDNGWDGVVGGPVKQPFTGAVAVCSWAVRGGHEAFPWGDVANWLQTRGGVFIPMVYRPEWTADRSPAIQCNNVPAISIYPADWDGIKKDIDDYKRLDRAQGIVFWSLSAFSELTSLTPSAMNERAEFVRALDWPTKSDGFTPPAPADPLALGERFRGPIFQVAGDMVNAGYANEGTIIQQVIRHYKGEISKYELAAYVLETLGCDVTEGDPWMVRWPGSSH